MENQSSEVYKKGLLRTGGVRVYPRKSAEYFGGDFAVIPEAGDQWASAEYRSYVAATLTKRCLREIAG